MIRKCYLVLPIYLPATPSASPSSSSTPSSSITSSAFSTAACSPSKSNPSCYHHRLQTHIPGLCTTFSHISRTVCVAIYCVAKLFLLKMYTSTSSKPDSCIASSKGGHSQQISQLRCGCLPVILRYTLCLKPSRARPMWGFITHIYDPKIITTCTTELNKFSNNCGLDPPNPKILDNLAHSFRTFLRLLTTTGH